MFLRRGLRPVFDGGQSFDALIVAFLEHLTRSGRTEATKQKYGQILRALAQHTRSPATLSSAEIETLLGLWHQSFVAAHGRIPSVATYRNQVAALRSFFDYLERADLLRPAPGRAARNPVRSISVPPAPSRPNDWLRPSEDKALLSVQANGQERIVITLLRWTGLRVSEATGLLVSDFDLSPGREALTVRVSKTPAGRRSVPIVPKLLPELLEWLPALDQTRFSRIQQPLLTTRHGTAMKPTYIWRIVKRVAHRANVRPILCTCGASSARQHRQACPCTRNGENLSSISPHTLRRTFGSDLLNRGLRLEVVSKLLGHASTTVTERAYADLLYDTARRELMQALGHEPS